LISFWKLRLIPRREIPLALELGLK